MKTTKVTTTPAFKTITLDLSPDMAALMLDALHLMKSGNDTELNCECLSFAEAEQRDEADGKPFDPEDADRNSRLRKLGYLTMERWRTRKLISKLEDKLGL